MLDFPINSYTPSDNQFRKFGGWLNGRLDRSTSFFVYGAIHEALQNVNDHAYPTGQGGRSLKFRQFGGTVFASVSDNGIGICGSLKRKTTVEQGTFGSVRGQGLTDILGLPAKLGFGKVEIRSGNLRLSSSTCGVVRKTSQDWQPGTVVEIFVPSADVSSSDVGKFDA